MQTAMEIFKFLNTWVSKGIVTEALFTNNIGQTLSGKLQMVLQQYLSGTHL